METRQGPHQVAQNSTMYALPFANSFTGSPCTHLPVCSLGAGSPTLSVAAAAVPNIALAASASIAPVKCNRMVFIIPQSLASEVGDQESASKADIEEDWN